MKVPDVTGKDPSDLSAIVRKTCSEIEKMCADQRMSVNRQPNLSNCEQKDFDIPVLKY